MKAQTVIIELNYHVLSNSEDFVIHNICSPLSCAVSKDEESVCLSFPNVVPPSFASVVVVPAPGSVATICKK